MNSAGIVRRADELGRIVLPKETGLSWALISWIRYISSQKETASSSGSTHRDASSAMRRKRWILRAEDLPELLGGTE